MNVHDRAPFPATVHQTDPAELEERRKRAWYNQFRHFSPDKKAEVILERLAGVLGIGADDVAAGLTAFTVAVQKGSNP